MYLFAVGEGLVEEGKSVVDVLGRDGYGIGAGHLGLPEDLDPLPRDRLRRLPGELGSPHAIAKGFDSTLGSAALLALARQLPFHGFFFLPVASAISHGRERERQ